MNRQQVVRHFWESQRQRIIDDLMQPEWGISGDKPFTPQGAIRCANTFIESMIFADMLPEPMEKLLRAAVAQRTEHRSSNANDARSTRTSRIKRKHRSGAVAKPSGE